jgi:hypothetical protein
MDSEFRTPAERVIAISSGFGRFSHSATQISEPKPVGKASYWRWRRSSKAQWKDR